MDHGRGHGVHQGHRGTLDDDLRHFVSMVVCRVLAIVLDFQALGNKPCALLWWIRGVALRAWLPVHSEAQVDAYVGVS